jgi:DNA-directed RNA polymerase alpha subunit
MARPDETVADAALSVRARNALGHICAARGWPDTAEWVSELTEQELVRTGNVGRRTVDEVKDWLASCGLRFKGEVPRAKAAVPRAAGSPLRIKITIEIEVSPALTESDNAKEA